jgi:hypothetical protein
MCEIINGRYLKTDWLMIDTDHMICIGHLNDWYQPLDRLSSILLNLSVQVDNGVLSTSNYLFTYCTKDET